MLITNMVSASCFLLVVFAVMVSAHPQPSIIRERHIIRTPIKFRVIHHYKVQRIPLIIRKHLHFYPNLNEGKGPAEEDESKHLGYNHLGDYHHGSDHPQEEDEHQEHHQDEQGIDYHENENEEEYEESQQSQEADYEDYEYE